MAQIIEGGALTFNSLAYGTPHPGTMNFLSQQFENASTVLTTAGARFMEGARDLYERISGSDAMRALRVAGRAVRSMWQLDEVRVLNTMDELQTAPLTMQRWVMAEPTIRREYHQQRIDGYSDTYIDAFPKDVGEEHYDYRRVMDGMVVVDEVPDDEGEYGWQATTYFDELLPDDNELLLEEKMDILDTWAAAKAALKARKLDPTSRYGASLG